MSLETPELKAKTFWGRDKRKIARIIVPTSRKGKIVTFTNNFRSSNAPIADPPEEILLTKYIERPHMIQVEKYLSEAQLLERETVEANTMLDKLIFYPTKNPLTDDPKNALAFWLKKLYKKYNPRCARLRDKKFCDCLICSRGYLLKKTIKKISCHVLGFPIFDLKNNPEIDYHSLYSIFNKAFVSVIFKTQNQRIIRMEAIPNINYIKIKQPKK